MERRERVVVALLVLRQNMNVIAALVAPRSLLLFVSVRHGPRRRLHPRQLPSGSPPRPQVGHWKRGQRRSTIRRAHGAKQRGGRSCLIKLFYTK